MKPPALMVLPVVLNSPYKLEPLQVAAGVTLKVLTVELFWTEISIVGLLPWETGPAGALMKMVEPMAKPGGSGLQLQTIVLCVAAFRPPRALEGAGVGQLLGARRTPLICFLEIRRDKCPLLQILNLVFSKCQQNKNIFTNHFANWK